MKYFVFTLLIGLLASCNSKDAKSLEQVEKMQGNLSELKEDFSAVDLKALSMIKKQYDESISLIKKYYFKDTIDVSFMNSLDYYKYVKYSFKTITKNKLVIKDNILILEGQLKSLKTDLENNSIQGKQLEEALKNESNNMAKLDSSVSIYVQSANTIITVHDSIANYVKNQTLSF